MYRAQLRTIIDVPWLSMQPIVVGPARAGAGTPDAYITVERDGRALARIDAYLEHAGAFTELQCWGRFVVLGWDCVVHLVDPITREAHAIGCDGYFGHLYRWEEHLVIATASELICLTERGDLLWKQAGLGIDGVVIDGIQEGVIHGRGEWDPPGGWRPFRVSAATGLPVSPAQWSSGAAE